jgi:hypothetical protein
MGPTEIGELRPADLVGAIEFFDALYRSSSD